MPKKLIIINHPEYMESPEIQELCSSDSNTEVVELYKKTADFDVLVDKIMEAEQIFTV